jgi:hypothetical protein
MKNLLIYIVVAFISTACMACTEMSVQEFCDHVSECAPKLYGSSAQCVSRINNEARFSPECSDEVVAYYECVGNGVCNGDNTAPNTCSRAALEKCRKDYGYGNYYLY